MPTDSSLPDSKGKFIQYEGSITGVDITCQKERGGGASAVAYPLIYTTGA